MSPNGKQKNNGNYLLKAPAKSKKKNIYKIKIYKKIKSLRNND